MTNRENQRRLDLISMKYLAAVEAGDFDALSALWLDAQNDPELGEMLHGLNAEIVAEQDAAEAVSSKAAIESVIEKHLPSAEIIRPESGPLTVAEVAEHIRKNPPSGVTADDLKLNDALRASSEAVPRELGTAQVVAWGRRLGVAQETYWKAFRQAALVLRMRRESAENYQMAARPTKPPPKPKEDQS
jgi:hypothetical protein